MLRRIAFSMWIGGALAMFPCWMKLSLWALVFFAISLIGGCIIGWTESRAH